jgi:hypothetical protein
VQSLINSALSTHQFPNDSTLSTELSAALINLLANFTLWSLVTGDSRSAHQRVLELVRNAVCESGDPDKPNALQLSGARARLAKQTRDSPTIGRR